MIVGNETTKQVFADIQCEDKQIIEHPEYDHGMLFQVDVYQIVLEEILQWVLKHMN